MFTFSEEPQITVTVPFRALEFAPTVYHAWRRRPVRRRDWVDAHPINAAMDMHPDEWACCPLNTVKSFDQVSEHLTPDNRCPASQIPPDQSPTVHGLQHWG